MRSPSDGAGRPLLTHSITTARRAHASGRWDEALAHYEAALALVPEGGDAGDAADILRWIGSVRIERGEVELAEDVFEVSHAIASRTGLVARVASALIALAVVHQGRGDLEEAEQLYQQAMTLTAASGDERLAAMVDLNLGTLANIRGEFAAALDRYESALVRSRRLGDDLTAAKALNNMAMTHVDLHEWEAAQEDLEAARLHAVNVNDAQMVGSVGLNQAELWLRRGCLPEAWEACSDSLRTFEQLRSRKWVAEAYKVRGMLCREMGEPLRSSAFLSAALGLAEVSENRLLQAETLMEISLFHLRSGFAREGIQSLNRALRIFGSLKAEPEILHIRRSLERAEGLYLPSVEQWSRGMFGARVEVEHAQRVAELSCAMAMELGLRGWEVTTIRVGALLHDIGKTALPSAGGASRSEYTILRVHPVAGDAILADLDFPDEVRTIVRSHHERLGGAGYPDRLTADRIPLGARIVAVANAFDRAVYARSADGTSPRRAIAALEAEAGEHFDPACVDALARRIRTAPGWSTARHGREVPAA